MTGRDLFIDALLSTLLPGDGDWPPALKTCVPIWFGERALAEPGLGGAVDWLRRSLPADFATRSPAERAGNLKACEAADSARFAYVVSEAFNGYYIDPAVLAVVERKTGFPARPPQPAGHRLEPFDASVLDGRKRPALS